MRVGVIQDLMKDFYCIQYAASSPRNVVLCAAYRLMSLENYYNDLKQAVNRPVGATTILKIEARELRPNRFGLVFRRKIESRPESQLGFESIESF